MLVQQILSAKPSQDVITISASSPVSAAVELLGKHRIGTLVVSEDGRKVEGILSERDVVRELSQVGAGVLDQAVASIMTTRIVTCRPGDTARSVAEQMTQGRFRHMPVVEGEAMVGLISIGDVVKWRLSELSMEKDALESMIKGY